MSNNLRFVVISLRMEFIDPRTGERVYEEEKRKGMTETVVAELKPTKGFGNMSVPASELGNVQVGDFVGLTFTRNVQKA